MTKFAAAMTTHIGFHVSYKDFLDDIYITYMFNPVGYSVNDVFFYGPHASRELRRENSLLGEMIESGLVVGHFRHLQNVDTQEIFHASLGRDDRHRGFFERMLPELAATRVADLESEDAIQAARNLDRLVLPEKFFKMWRKNDDDSLIDTGVSYEVLVNNLIDPKTRSTLLSNMGDHPLAVKTINEFEEIQDFIANLMDAQKALHEGGGFRVSSAIRAAAQLSEIDNFSEIDMAYDLLIEMRKRNLSKQADTAAKAFRLLIDRHSKNMSDFFGAGYSNPKSEFLDRMVGIEQHTGQTEAHSDEISQTVELPDLSIFQSLSIMELNRILQELGFDEYAEAFHEWNSDPSSYNVERVVLKLKNIEQALKSKYSGVRLRKMRASFFTDILRSIHREFTYFAINAQQQGIVQAVLTPFDIAAKTGEKFMARTVGGNIQLNPLKPVGDKVTDFLASGSATDRYEQFLLSESRRQESIPVALQFRATNVSAN